MPDISGALDALRNAISAVLYPTGVPPGAAPPSVAGGPVKVYVGWPGADLDTDLAAGVTHVSVWPRSGMSFITQYLTGWTDLPPPASSMAAMVDGGTVTFSGTAATPRMIAAVSVDGQDGATFTHRIVPGETPAQVAAAFAAGIGATIAATSSGAVLSVPGRVLEAAVVAGGIQVKELRRQRQGIMVTVWAPTQALRDAISSRIDAHFEETRSILAADGTFVSVFADGTALDEAGRQHPLRRRDLLMTIEFRLIATAEAEAVLGTVHPTILTQV